MEKDRRRKLGNEIQNQLQYHDITCKHRGDKFVNLLGGYKQILNIFCDSFMRTNLVPNSGGAKNAIRNT